jgi:hypothetical protein
VIKPWLFEFLPELGGPSVEPDARDVAALFARYLDLWARDEALGFEGIFFSEVDARVFDKKSKEIKNDPPTVGSDDCLFTFSDRR